MKAIASVAAGALLLVWPAALNLYPLVFIDTASYLLHGAMGEPPWDKTQAYGPAIAILHRHWTLWPPVAAQGLAASHLIWLLVRSLRGAASPAAHLAVCAGLAALTSSPWFLATLMPDALTGLAPLCLFLLAFGALSRVEAMWVTLLGALAIAAHLSHLPTAFALVVLTALLARRIGPVLRAAAPLALAILFLLGSNLAGFGRTTLSPHGAVFLLARLQADGPAAETLRARCPEAGRHLCAFADRLPMDSDEFLWDGASPLNREADGSYRPMGGMRGAAEAREIIAATLGDHPGAVVRAMLANTLRQLILVRVGDTLSDEHLALSARRGIADHFPPAELAAFDAGAQMRGELPGRAAPFLLPQLPVLLGALAAALAMLWTAARRRDLRRGAVLLFALVALGANAAATGALSKPHHRYQARIVWLLPLAVGAALLRQPRPRRSAARPQERAAAQ